MLNTAQPRETAPRKHVVIIGAGFGGNHGFLFHFRLRQLDQSCRGRNGRGWCEDCLLGDNRRSRSSPVRG